MSAQRLGLVTGGSSGIGLIVVTKLLREGWDVAILDLNAPPADSTLPKDRVLFVKTDVSHWESQAAAFKTVFAWKGRIDFAFLNAGVTCTDEIFYSAKQMYEHKGKAPPQKPNMAASDISFTGVYYGVKLFAYYHLRGPSSPGNIIVTSSIAGLYHFDDFALYSAAKAASLQFVRHVAKSAQSYGGTRINAICPSYVATNLSTVEMRSEIPPEVVIPPSMVERAIGELLDEEIGHNGQAVEITFDNLTYRVGDKPTVEGPSASKFKQLQQILVEHEKIKFDAQIAKEIASV